MLAVLGHLRGDRGHLGHLVPRRVRVLSLQPCAALGARLQLHLHDSRHLLGRQHRAPVPLMSGLAPRWGGPWTAGTDAGACWAGPTTASVTWSARSVAPALPRPAPAPPAVPCATLRACPFTVFPSERVLTH